MMPIMAVTEASSERKGKEKGGKGRGKREERRKGRKERKRRKRGRKKRKKGKREKEERRKGRRRGSVPPTPMPPSCRGTRTSNNRTRYVRPPLGYRQVDRRGVPIVWKLVGNCYGDETAPRVWFESLLPVLLEILFVQSDADPCFLFKVYPDGSRFDMVLYVDDILACDDAGAQADADFDAVQKVFKFTIRDEAVHFLNMNVSVLNEWTVKLSMEAYLLKMADTYVPDWRNWSLMDRPATEQLQVDYDEAHGRRDNVLSAELLTRYKGKVGALSYAAPTVRADVASRLSRAQTFATAQLEEHVDRCIVYLAQTADTGLTFDGSVSGADELWAASDSDWAVGHSTTGFAIYWGGAAVLHSSKRQQCIATSSGVSGSRLRRVHAGWSGGTLAHAIEHQGRCSGVRA